MININLSKSLNSPQGQMNLEIDIKVRKGEFIALYGPSGSGKTSTLRLLAGLMAPDSGLVELEGKKWFDHSANIYLKPQDRNIGFVFQDYALFPNMTVLENLKFANKNQDQSLLDELISITELGDLQHAFPGRLSGGQQQRVALARAVAQRPTLLLLDEPLSAVDFELRQKLQTYIKQVHNQYALTTIMISHDQKEIINLADRCIVLKNGKIIKAGSAIDVFIGESDGLDSKLFGNIVHINRESDRVIVTVDIQDSLIQLSLPLEEAKDLQKGNSITFTQNKS